MLNYVHAKYMTIGKAINSIFLGTSALSTIELG